MKRPVYGITERRTISGIAAGVGVTEGTVDDLAIRIEPMDLRRAGYTHGMDVVVLSRDDYDRLVTFRSDAAGRK